ncbi:serine protease [Streptomyces sp. YIM 98790]|uniref:trypsin-like serine peptidase n=1 Tax=Streptomyces sp. YIM 98790 TaxID=2689077 RepID=UPI00140CF1D3|nr:trypsin-like peptidase domain-containing protein [Streptomyces sp. YIM 98790]
MSLMRRRHRAALAAGAVAAALALTATACGPGEDEAGSGGKEDNQPVEKPDSQEDRLNDLLDALPVDIDVDKWKDGEWKNWDQDQWLREAGEYIGIIIEDFWDADRMRDALDMDRGVDEEEIEDVDPGEEEPPADDPDDDRGVTDPDPVPVEAVAEPAPYTGNNPAVGKIFMETPEGTMVCSGSVVKDPDNPGKSNLVATAGHCVHAGAEGGWFRNVAFVPAYNSSGVPLEESVNLPFEEIAPLGIWWAEYVGTTDYWVQNGTAVGGDGAHQDFAVMKVVPEEGTTQSLEEMTGAAYDITFDAPAVSQLSPFKVIGYPAAEPFDGEQMYSCTDQPTRLSLDPAQPVMYRVGCTMTAGSSGGPWIHDGALISVTSIGPYDSTWLAGPRLEADCEEVFDTVRTS